MHGFQKPKTAQENQQKRFQRMTREPEGQQFGLLDKRTMVTELERLAVHFPRTDMDERKWGFLYDAFWEDCRLLTTSQFRNICRAYRQNPANRFFPTPGQLLDAAHSPMDDVYIVPEHEKYKALPAPEISEEEIAKRSKMLKELIAQQGVIPDSGERADPKPYTTLELQIHSKLASALLENLNKRIDTRHG